MKVYRLEKWISTMKINQLFDGLYYFVWECNEKNEWDIHTLKMSLKEKIDVYRTHNRSWSLSWTNSDWVENVK